MTESKLRRTYEGNPVPGWYGVSDDARTGAPESVHGPGSGSDVASSRQKILSQL